jgi:hypothetical protein
MEDVFENWYSIPTIAPVTVEPAKLRSVVMRGKREQAICNDDNGGKMINTLAEALAPLAARMSRPVRQHEVLRVAGILMSNDPVSIANSAKKEVLKWAQNRAGSRLPSEAWNHQSFDCFSGGRNISGLRLQTDGADLWAIRADDPDKAVPGRVWTNEVVIGLAVGQPARFSARLIASTAEGELAIEPHVPGYIQQVATQFRLFAGTQQVETGPRIVEEESDAYALITDLLDPQRVLPTFVLTHPEDKGESCALLDPDTLAKATLGLAHVVVARPAACWHLTERLGKLRSVYRGAVRVYLPGFAEDADPYRHRLVLPDQMATPEGAVRTMLWLRQFAAQSSLHRVRLGADVLAFAAIRDASLRLRQETLRVGDASDADQLAAAQARIDALQKQIKSLEDEQAFYLDEYEKERERAEAAEGQAQASAYRIQHLTDLIKQRGEDPDEDVKLPQDWTGFVDWCQQTFAGRLVLASNARRGVRKPHYADIETAARCLLWLATTGRDQRIGGGAPMSNVPILSGIHNAPCGSDTYEFDWEGRRFSADWHVKNGGNTRDPVRCLRIYYCFDEQTQQIIVSDMPAHRTTDVS